MKTLVSFCKLESDVFAKFTIRLESKSEQYKAITRLQLDGRKMKIHCRLPVHPNFFHFLVF